MADFGTEVSGGNAVILDPGGLGVAVFTASLAGDGGNSRCFIATAALILP